MSTLTLCIAGSPNSGKTTIYNTLTGLRQKTGNYTGVTVEKHEAIITLENGTRLRLLDLPGTYHISSKSEDEKIASDILTTPGNPDYPNHILFVANALQLKTSLYFLCQLLEKGHSITLILSMWDEFKEQGHTLDVVTLSNKLGIPVHTFSKKDPSFKKLILSNDYKLKTSPNVIVPKPVLEKYDWIEGVLKDSHYQINKYKKQTFLSWIEHVSTHKVWGLIIFLSLLTLIFQSVFYLSEYPMQWIEQGFISLAQYLDLYLPNHIISQFFTGAFLNGISAVLMFVPQIALLFFFIHLLEESGYMPRVSFLMDKIMGVFGLSGKSVIPFMNAYACAVPAIMATRTISNPTERKIAIFTLPFITCSARLPVYTLFISLLADDSKHFFWGMQGLLLTAMYLLGLFTSLIASLVLSKFLQKSVKTPFLMEIPKFRTPHLKSVLISVSIKIKTFVWDTGRIILIASLILWILGNTGPDYKGFNQKPAEFNIENSYLGHFGKTIEPVIKPLGYDWKIGVAILSSFAAREAFVATMSAIYGLENQGQSLMELLKNDKNPLSGQRKYSFACCISLILFYAFAMQCISTMAVVYRESRSLIWVLFQFVVMLIVAYASAYVGYNLFLE